MFLRPVIDADTVRFEVISMLIAARDTVHLASCCRFGSTNHATSLYLQTSTLLTFVLYFLCMHPEVTESLRQEIVNEYGRDGIPTLERTRNLPYRKLLLYGCRILLPLVHHSFQYVL